MMQHLWRKKKKAAAANNVIEFETSIERLKKWAVRQSLPIEAAVETAIGAASGAFKGFVFDVFKETICAAISKQTPSTGLQLDEQKLASCGGYRPLVYSFIAASRVEWARNYAVVSGVDAGITCVMNRLTGKDDVHTQMVAAFGSGVAVSLVTGMRGPDVLQVGVMFALINGLRFKLKEEYGQQKAQDVIHDKVRDIFSSNGLGVDHYATNYSACTNYNTRTLSRCLMTGKKEMKNGLRHVTLHAAGEYFEVER